MLKKIVSFMIFFVVLFSSLFFSASANYTLNSNGSDVDSYYLYNFENNLYMAEYGVETIIAPSATVKMMTACVALEAGIDTGKVITVNSDMLDGVTGRTMNLKAGDRLTVLDLLYATVCGGYNDASQSLAFAVSGSLSDFIAKMNEKASQLDMTATNYLNVTGMDEAGMHTCVLDIIKLAKHLAKNDTFVNISSASTYKLSDIATCDKKTISNRSSLLSSYKGLSNFCTGSGDFGGCNVLYYKRSDLSFLCIVMGASSKNDDDDIACAEDFSRELLSHALYDYSYKTVLSEKSAVASLPVMYSSASENIDLYLQGDVKVYIPKDIDEKNDLTYNYYVYGDGLKAPLKSGDEVGEMIVSYDGRTLACVPLIVKDDVERSGFLYFLDIIKNYVKSPAFISSCVIFVCLMIAYYLYMQRLFKVVIHRSSKKQR